MFRSIDVSEFNVHGDRESEPIDQQQILVFLLFAFNRNWSILMNIFLKFIAKHSFRNFLWHFWYKHREQTPENTVNFSPSESEEIDTYGLRNAKEREREKGGEGERERWNVINYYPIRSHNICSVYAVIKA